MGGPCRWLASVVLAVFTAGLPLPAPAARSGGSGAAVLVIDQMLVTDARGAVTAATHRALLRRPGSAAQGLLVPWNAALDRPVDGAGLALAPLVWQDPPLAVTEDRLRLAPSSGTPIGLPVDSLAIRIDRLSALAASAIDRAAPDLAVRIAATLRQVGVNEAWFNFRQQVPVLGRTRQVAWTLHVADSGAWFATTPALDVPGTVVLHASYTPLTAVAGLPSTYRYREGGWLRWALSDPGGHPLPGGGARDTHGAFDGDAGLACLLGLRAASGCDPAQEGVPGLIERLGAAQADLTVARSLRPVYAATSAGQRIALASLAVERTLAGGGAHCSMPPWRYTNAYTAAFRLDSRLDRYALGADGRWTLQSSSRAVLDAPMTPWKTLSLELAAGDLPQLAQLVIDPDSDRLVRLDAFPAGLEQIAAGPVSCR